MVPTTFRRARRSDLTDICQLLADDPLGQGREAVPDPLDGSPELDERYVAAFRAIDADPNQLLVVAESGGETIGCLQLTFIPGLSRSGMWRGQIESVRVAAEHRGTGNGRALFEWAIQQCRERGCGLVQLTTDKSRTGAAHFYASLGFEATHEGLKLPL